MENILGLEEKYLIPYEDLTNYVGKSLEARDNLPENIYKAVKGDKASMELVLLGLEFEFEGLPYSHVEYLFKEFPFKSQDEAQQFLQNLYMFANYADKLKESATLKSRAYYAKKIQDYVLKAFKTKSKRDTIKTWKTIID